MAYIGSTPARSALTSAHIADGAVNSDEIATGAVDLAHLSATGTAGSGNFLRGDNAWTAPALGKIVQIKSMSTTTQTTTTGTSFVATGLTLAFTQVAAGNYCYIVATAPAGGGLTGGATQSRGHYALFRGVGELARTSHNILAEHTPGNDWAQLGMAQVVTAYSSAGDTSAHTYTVQIKDQDAASASTIYWNYYVSSASTSTITIMEFAA
jgi:hypothetical protein